MSLYQELASGENIPEWGQIRELIYTAMPLFQLECLVLLLLKTTTCLPGMIIILLWIDAIIVSH